VGREAIELDYQVGVGPVEVDLVARDSGTGCGPRQSVSLDQCEEPVLQNALGQLERAGGRREQPGAAAARIAANRSDEGGHVQEAQVFRLVDGSLEGLSG